MDQPQRRNKDSRTNNSLNKAAGIKALSGKKNPNTVTWAETNKKTVLEGGRYDALRLADLNRPETSKNRIGNKNTKYNLKPSTNVFEPKSRNQE
jgi:hypothetical protein